MAWIAGLLIAAMMVIITADVVLRNLGYQSSAHFFTFTEYALLVVPCLGAPWLVREKGHIYVEILQRVAIQHESESLRDLQALWKKEEAELARRGLKTVAQSPEASKRFYEGARSASLARMKERMEKAGGMENYDKVIQLFTPGK